MSGVDFVDETWNPWQGCYFVSTGCTNCYMYREKIFYKQDPMNVIRSKDPTFCKPLKMPAGKWVFTCSWSDFFVYEADSWRAQAWEIIRARPDILFIIITKRHQMIAKRLPRDWGDGFPNVVLGFTGENQTCFDARWNVIKHIPARHYLCMHEPAVSGISYPHDFLSLGNRAWVIAGGETGPDARPSHVDWFRSDRSQCQVYGVPFYFKQWGEWEWWNPSRALVANYSDIYKWPDNTASLFVGSKKSGSLLDNKIHREKPAIELATSKDQLSLF